MTVGPWYCDTCGDPTITAEDGFVIWKIGSEGTDSGRDFKIIHQFRCDQKEYLFSLPLEDFLGLDGLTMLLSFLSNGPLKLGGDLTGNSRGVHSTDEFIDFVRRLQIPGYEAARQRFRDIQIRERFSDANEYIPYQQRQLMSIINQP